MKTRLSLIAVAVLVGSVAVAHAQNGCVNSPECPTALLAVVGGLGAAVVRRFRR